MGVIDRIKKFKFFGGGKYFSEEGRTGDQKVAAVKSLTNDLVTNVLFKSDFNDMDEEDIYEQLYLIEPEIGGAIDRTSTMVGEAFKGFTIRDVGEKLDDLETEMVKEANKLSYELSYRNYFEMFAEILEMKGNLYLDTRNPLTLKILPNKYVTLLDSLERISHPASSPVDFITEANYLVLFEGCGVEPITIAKDGFVHIKYKDTPIFEEDQKGRMTYGIYSISPLHRVILAVWWKRQTMVVDMLMRQKMVPREVHKIAADMFAYNTYSGTPEQKRVAALADAKTFIEDYSKDIQSKTPDQGYVVLDTSTIEMLDTGSGNRYMQTNELMDQINNQIWAALNMPKSMIAGESDSSYASELIIANYASQKIMQLANKIKPILLENMKLRLRAVNENYPVDKLDIKIELNMASTDIEQLRALAVRGALGIYTETELRDLDGFAPLRKEQRKELVNTGAKGIDTSIPKRGNVPQTPQSDAQHSNVGRPSIAR